MINRISFGNFSGSPDRCFHHNDERNFEDDSDENYSDDENSEKILTMTMSTKVNTTWVARNKFSQPLKTIVYRRL